MSLLVRALTVLAAVAAAAIGWGIRIFLGAIAAFLVIIIGVGVAGQIRRARRCDPCNGTPGICTCTSKARCPHPLCGAADTRVSNEQFSRELRALLDREGGQR